MCLKLKIFLHSADERKTILAGMQMIEERTSINGKNCISFKQRTNEINYVKVVSDIGCYSKVGQSGGQQILSLQKGTNSPGCVTTDTVAHEFIHVLGKINFSDFSNFLCHFDFFN